MDKPQGLGARVAWGSTRQTDPVALWLLTQQCADSHGETLWATSTQPTQTGSCPDGQDRSRHPSLGSLGKAEHGLDSVLRV